jgi:ubiquinone/menaquinone biosynthesis C-methylase UbiE
MVNLKKYLTIFDELNLLNAYQFKNRISSSQYLLAYQLVLQYAPTHALILDWGTGSGHFSLFLLEEQFKVTGFSIQDNCHLSKYLTDKFHDQYKLIIDPESIKKIPFKTNSFDVITSIGVLEHVRESGGNEYDSLLEIKRILKPGGVFICYHFPNKYSWIEAITKNIKNKHNHSYKYSRQDIQKLIKQVNLAMIDTKRYGLLPRLMFSNFPDYSFVARLYNYADIILSKLFNLVCQNHCNYQICRKF